MRGDSWLWLVPEHPQEIAAGVQIIEGSDNTLSPSLLMHSPSAQASAAARAAFEAVAPGSSEGVIEIRVRAAAELVAVDEVLERLAALYDRDAIVPPPASAGNLRSKELGIWNEEGQPMDQSTNQGDWDAKC